MLLITHPVSMKGIMNMTDEKKEKQETPKVTLEDVLKQVEALQDENKKLKEELDQSKLQLASISLGGKKVETKEEKSDEPVEFDFDF